MSYSDSTTSIPKSSHSLVTTDDEHMIKLEKLCEQLNTNSYDGLTCKYAKQLLKDNGMNKYTRPDSSSKSSLFKNTFKKGKVNGSCNHWSKKDWDRVFNCRVNLEYIVIRDSKKSIVRGQEIVRGDLIYLRAGQTVPADIRIISYNGELTVDNRVITGNPAELKSSSPTSTDFLLSQNVIFANTIVLNGSCEGIVLKTGDDTVFGELTQFATKVKYIPRKHVGSFGSNSAAESFSLGTMSLPSTLSLGSDGSYLPKAASTMSL